MTDHSTSGLVNITGDNFVSNHRKSKIGAELAFIYKTILNTRKECKFSDSEVIHSIFVEIIFPQGKKHCRRLCIQGAKSKHCLVSREIQ